MLRINMECLKNGNCRELCSCYNKSRIELKKQVFGTARVGFGSVDRCYAQVCEAFSFLSPPQSFHSKVHNLLLLLLPWRQPWRWL